MPPERNLARGSTGGLGPFLVLAILLTVASCAVPDFLRDGRERAFRLAAASAWTYREFHARTFTLAGFHNGLAGSADELVVYVEGDGQPWITPFRMSPDPTPPKPVVLGMAVADPAPKILYLGRPCQYTGPEAPACGPEYWTSRRYSDEVLRAFDDALDEAVAIARVRKLSLVGYSGGGSIAVLLAARRQDVATIITAAANLDHAAWTRFHGDAPLTGSLNAADFATAVQSIPQVHFMGARDETVPLEIVEAYVRRMAAGAAALAKAIPEYDHECCWAEQWPALLEEARAWLGDADRKRTRGGAAG